MASERPDTKGIVASGYDAVADRYEALEHDDRPWPRMRWLAVLLALLDDDSSVLEVGCGNGVPATRAIARKRRSRRTVLRGSHDAAKTLALVREAGFDVVPAVESQLEGQHEVAYLWVLARRSES